MTPRPPTLQEIGVAALWPCLLIAALVAAGLFDLTLLTAAIWADFDARSAMRAAAGVGAAACVVPGAIALLCYFGAAIDARGPARRATWLARVAEAVGALTKLLRAALIAALALLAVALLVMPAEVGDVVIFACGLVLVPLALRALRTMDRRTRAIAARTRRWARRLCPGCDYDNTGLARCPECGRTVAPPRRPWPLPRVRSIRV